MRDALSVASAGPREPEILSYSYLEPDSEDDDGDAEDAPPPAYQITTIKGAFDDGKDSLEPPARSPAERVGGKESLL